MNAMGVELDLDIEALFADLYTEDREPAVERGWVSQDADTVECEYEELLPDSVRVRLR